MLSAVPEIVRVAPTVDRDGTVEGYASLFGEIDQARDMVMPGAFAQTLRTRGLRRIPMLFQHDPSEPIGIWLDLQEDFRGLKARGRLIPDVARAREVLALVRAGAVDGLSIGFRTVRGRIDPRTRIRKLETIDLWEISIVTFPLLAGARVRAVKAEPSPACPGRGAAGRPFSAVLPRSSPTGPAFGRPDDRLRERLEGRGRRPRWPHGSRRAPAERSSP